MISKERRELKRITIIFKGCTKCNRIFMGKDNRGDLRKEKDAEMNLCRILI